MRAIGILISLAGLTIGTASIAQQPSDRANDKRTAAGQEAARHERALAEQHQQFLQSQARRDALHDQRAEAKKRQEALRHKQALADQQQAWAESTKRRDALHNQRVEAQRKQEAIRHEQALKDRKAR